MGGFLQFIIEKWELPCGLLDLLLPWACPWESGGVANDASTCPSCCCKLAMCCCTFTATWTAANGSKKDLYRWSQAESLVSAAGIPSGKVMAIPVLVFTPGNHVTFSASTNPCGSTQSHSSVVSSRIQLQMLICTLNTPEVTPPVPRAFVLPRSH